MSIGPMIMAQPKVTLVELGPANGTETLAGTVEVTDCVVVSGPTFTEIVVEWDSPLLVDESVAVTTTL